jgi:hypothetical protein
MLRSRPGLRHVAEVAVHPADGDNGRHEPYLIQEDVEAIVAATGEHAIACAPVPDRGRAAGPITRSGPT